MKTLTGPLAERQRAAQERVNESVTTMDAAFEALDAAGRALAEADDTNRDERQTAFEEASEAFDVAERDVFASEKEAQRIERMAAARSKVVDLPASRHAQPGEGRVVTGELTYRKFEGRADNWQDPTFHYLRDLYRAQCKADPEAVKRLVQHASEAALEGRANNANTTDGSGGEFVPPLWLQDEWIALPRPGRPAAALIQNRPLPPGTDSINLPKITTGTLVATQTEAGAVTQQSIVTTSVTAALQTKAGQIDVSQQIVDRSNPTIDAILFSDLANAYDVQIDTEVVNGTATNGKGFLQLSGTLSSTYTSASPTVAGLYPKGADVLQQIATNVYLPGTAWLMHPRRWAFFLAALDSQNRPLIVPSDAPGFNQAGVADALGVPAENVAGSWHGLPVVLDASIPTTLGAGTNEDRIIGLRSSNCILFEDGTPRTRAHEQVLDGTLQVRLQLYNYFALMNGRLPASIGVISGTGLATPTF